MGKFTDRLRGLLGRRKPAPGLDKAPATDVSETGAIDPGTAVHGSEAPAESEAAVDGHLPVADAAPAHPPAETLPVPAPEVRDERPAGTGATEPVPGAPAGDVPTHEGAPVPADAPAPAGDAGETLPVPVAREPDLVFTVTGAVGRPGVDLSYRHVETDVRGRDRFPEAFFPAEVRPGEYLLDVTGHALSFGLPGRTGSHVLVPVRTRKDSPDAMPPNALGNALVPIEVRMVDRIDRETAASKTRLRRPPVVGIVFRNAPLAEVDPSVDAEPVDASASDDDDLGLSTSSEDRARDDLAAMGYLLAQQTFDPPETAAMDDREGEEGEGKDGTHGQGPSDDRGDESIPRALPGDENLGDALHGGSEWSPSGAYGR